MARSPYAGRRLATASVPRVDELRFLKRYEQTQNLAQCLREFGLGERRGRTILSKHGVEVHRKERAPVDERTVLRGFDVLESVTAVAILHGVDEKEVRTILDRHGVLHDSHGPELGYDSESRRRARERRRLADEPSPGDRDAFLASADAARVTPAS